METRTCCPHTPDSPEEKNRSIIQLNFKMTFMKHVVSSKESEVSTAMGNCLGEKTTQELLSKNLVYSKMVQMYVTVRHLYSFQHVAVATVMVLREPD